MDDFTASHERAARDGVTFSDCDCKGCQHGMLLIWSRSLLAYCGAVDTSTHGEWR
jgi:hypothetical protein